MPPISATKKAATVAGGKGIDLTEMPTWNLIVGHAALGA